MPRARHVCAQPGCPTLIDYPETRCTPHEREIDKKRGTRQERGYDATHDRLRAAWQDRLSSGEDIRCWRCGAPIDPNLWHLGHDDNDRRLHHGPECPTCNLSAAGRASHDLPPF